MSGLKLHHGPRYLHWSTRTLVIAVTAIALSAGVAAGAQLVGSGGAITGCANSGGALRIVTPGGSCHSGETGVAWTQQALNWRSLWSSSATYSPDDAVGWNGSSWIAVTTSSNSTPQMGSNAWAPLSPAGSNGLNGLTGQPGNQGPPGPPGVITAQSAWYDTPTKSVPDTNNTQWTRVMTMKIKYPGPYTVFAKLVFSEDPQIQNDTEGGCELVAGTDTDYTNVGTGSADETTLQLNVAHTFTGSDDTAYVACETGVGGAVVYHIKMTAINTGWPYYAWK